MNVKLTRGLKRLLFALGLCLITFSAFFLLSSAQNEKIVNDDNNYIVTDLEIRTCYKFTHCSSKKGWVKVPKRLDYNAYGRPWSRFSNQFLFVKKIQLDKLKRKDRVVTNFKVVDSEERWTYNLDLYDEAHFQRYYYDIDVLFGEDSVDPRNEWDLHKTKLSGINGAIPVYLTLKTQLIDDPRPKIKLKLAKKNFKVLQVADLHFSSFEGICRDQYPEIENCKADPRTVQFLNTVLDIEKPNLVVLTGDQIFGEDSFDSVTTMLKVLAPFIERKIPYALMFGNHDDEGSLSRKELMDFCQKLPYNIATPGPEEVDGVGNYVFQVEERDSKKSALSFYVLDSHKYSPKPRILPGYDWLKQNQLDFVEQQYNLLKGNEGSTHLSFAFLHIPLTEYRNIDQQFTGNYKEGVTAPKHNTGGRDVFRKVGISVVSSGHDHCNDYCLLDSKEGEEDNNIWLCYGGGSGEGGYGGYGGTTRRLRIFNVDAVNGKVESYKRLETSPKETFDHQVLV